MSPMGFDDFFREATGLSSPAPYDYQRRLAVARASGGLPKLLAAPTGLGKTAAAVLAWLWRRRFHEQTDGREATPRRLVYCLPMRVLVEQTYVEAVRWLDRLGMLAGSATWRDPDQRTRLERYDVQPQSAILAREGWAHRHGDRGLPIAVHILLGGQERTDWVLWPERDAVLIGTQDMLLSRALNRGYAAGRARWPMEFGLLNNDCLWVFDEVQLMGSGLATSLQLQAWRESLQLRASRDSFPVSAPDPVFRPARSLWMSATMAKHWLKTAVDWRPKAEEAWTTRERLKENEKTEGSVGELFRTTKSLRTKPVAKLDAPAKQAEERANREYLENLASQIVGEHAPSGVTLVVMNTVGRAVGLYELLRGEAKGVSVPVHLIHSRFRPYERRQWVEHGILSKHNAEARLVISTQVVEAGVDFSAGVLFTELAPWASLVQRFGRCARFANETGRVYWTDLPAELARPYEPAELDAARAKLGELGDKGVGLAALDALSIDEAAAKTLLPYAPRFVPREKDLFDLFDTTPDLTGADLDISRFIRDGRDLDVLVYWRTIDIGQPTRRHRPWRDELCPVPFYKFQDAVKELRKGGHIWRQHYREGWQEMGEDDREVIFPGQVFLLEPGCGGYSPDVGWTGDPYDKVTPVPIDPSEALSEEDASSCDHDELDAQSEGAQWLTIAEHCGNVLRHLERGILQSTQIGEALDSPSPSLRVLRVLSVAARWHDRGKAHVAFQKKLQEEQLMSEATRKRLGGEAAAKAPKKAWLDPRNSSLPRRGFRHELASALAALETLRGVRADHAAFRWPEGLARASARAESRGHSADGGTSPLIEEIADLTAEEVDLFVYLIASHHGKVRMSLRSSPDDGRRDVPDPCPGETPQARGVREGDILPACGLPGHDGAPLQAPEVELHLDPMTLGLSDRYGSSWRERAQGLLETLGPFRLAYLEALLRAADWRASSEEREPPPDRRGVDVVREPPQTYESDRPGLREFVEHWKEAGPALEEQRSRDLQELDDEAARRMTLDLFQLWRPSDFDGMGEGLVDAQQVFIKLARSERRRER